jgi:hypothetical protein
MQALAAKTLRHRTQIPLLFTSGLLVRQRFQVTAILALAELLRQAQQTLAVDIAHVIGDFLDAGDLEALAHLDCAHELGGGHEMPRDGSFQSRPRSCSAE